MPHTGPLILASTSAPRRQLLSRLRVPFTTAAPAVDETPRAGEAAAPLAGRLAAAKARAIAGGLSKGLVIGGDQTVDCAGQLLGKPLNPETARAQLAASSGRRVVFHSAICVVDAASGASAQATVPVTARFRDLEPVSIARYVAAEPALQAAGSFHIEGLGVSLFDEVSSDDPTALVGLPLIALCRLLRELGYDVLAHAAPAAAGA